ncbi:hydroxymethylglutaryl-CoA reductase, degradative [Candidatus Micrarchaeota archaeon]|nr:hydroxymethylglutaryl-CoA reductase, degradative [Candidatus Micrarchaeota archaeon]
MANYSELSNLYKLDPQQRVAQLVKSGLISREEGDGLLAGFLPIDTANRMIESVIGKHPLPLGLAANFRINNRDFVVPMAIEEPSVVAAATNAAKLALPQGFSTSADEPIMTGQVQLVGIGEPQNAVKAVKAAEQELVKKCNETNPTLVKVGGGCRGLNARQLTKNSVVVNFDVDVRDAMGANTINTMAEEIGPDLEKLSSGKVRLRILTNLADKRLARASVEYKKDVVGEDVVDGVVDAYEFAFNDPYRACTHNKGIMNGIDSVVIATGNDWRAIEAGAHAYACRSGSYKPLTKWEKTKQGNLHGEITIPLALGLVGGATKTHPVAQISLKILGVKTAQELAQIVAAVGLAQNFAALRALSTTGIQKGHMALHAKNIVVIAGAKGEEIEKVASIIAQEKKVTVDRAKEVLKELRK